MRLQTLLEEKGNLQKNKYLIMQTSRELTALLNLIEDPDESVYQSVSSRLLTLGDEVLPVLDEHKLHIEDHIQLSKLEQIIHKIELSTLEKSLEDWKKNTELTLLDASMFLSSYINRDSDKEHFVFEIEKIRKTAWLELNDYLTPLEEINILNRTIFDFNKLRGLETNYSNKQEFDLFHLLSSKKGNSFSLAALYLIIAELLGIALKPVNIPKQNLLCYISEENPFEPSLSNQILFFLNPLSGQVYTHRDIENYLKKIDSIPYPITNSEESVLYFIQNWLFEIAKSEKEAGLLFKQQELKRIASSLV
jgi:hypothetical protein